MHNTSVYSASLLLFYFLEKIINTYSTSPIYYLNNLNNSNIMRMSFLFIF